MNDLREEVFEVKVDSESMPPISEEKYEANVFVPKDVAASEVDKSVVINELNDKDFDQNWYRMQLFFRCSRSIGLICRSDHWYGIR
jgi:hypothetical protein